jgi:hypothetical protein
MQEFGYAERLASIVGAPALLDKARLLDDVYTAYKTEFERAHQAARGVGLTEPQWRELLRGPEAVT